MNIQKMISPIDTIRRRRHSGVTLAPASALTFCCLLFVFNHLPKVANQQRLGQLWQQPQALADFAALPSDRDRYQLIGEDEAQALVQHAGPASSSSSSLMLADLLNSFGMARQERLTPASDATRPQPTHGGDTPGHYEFEVAPRMEPPGAPKPPFHQASTSCPGSGELAPRWPPWAHALLMLGFNSHHSPPHPRFPSPCIPTYSQISSPASLPSTRSAATCTRARCP